MSHLGPPHTSRRFWLRGILLVLGGVALALFAAWVYFGSPWWTSPPAISRETTYLTQPLAADGYPDYLAAINRHFARGIEPEENAAVPLWQALGPAPGGEPQPAETFRWLQMKAPPPRGQYYKLQEEVYSIPRGHPDAPEFLEESTKVYFHVFRTLWRPGQYVVIEHWLRVNRRPLELCLRASQRKKFFMPVVGSRSGFLHERVGIPDYTLRSMCVALQIHAMRELGQGNAEQCWQELLALKRLGRLFAQHSTLLPALSGYNVDEWVFEAIPALLARCPRDPQRLRRWASQWDSLPPMPSLTKRQPFSLRAYLLNAVVSSYLGIPYDSGAYGVPVRPIFRGADWNLALRLCNQKCDKLEQRLAPLADPVAIEKATDVFISPLFSQESEMESYGWLLPLNRRFRTQYQAVGLIKRRLLSYSTANSAHVRLHQKHLLVRAALALERYRAEQGQYPEKLQQLVPRYLSEVPPDLYSGEPIKYRHTTDSYVVYSVGANQKDDGGVPQPEDVIGGDYDLVLLVPPPWLKTPPPPDPQLPSGSKLLK